MLPPVDGVHRYLMSLPASPSWKPRVRPELVFRRVGEDWVVFDPAEQDIHVLNLSAALVWSYCTGEHEVATIEREVARAWEDVDDPGVREALREFADAGLLETE